MLQCGTLSGYILNQKWWQVEIYIVKRAYYLLIVVLHLCDAYPSTLAELTWSSFSTLYIWSYRRFQSDTELFRWNYYSYISSERQTSLLKKCKQCQLHYLLLQKYLCTDEVQISSYKLFTQRGKCNTRVLLSFHLGCGPGICWTWILSRSQSDRGGPVDLDNLIADNLIAANYMKNWKIR